MKIILSVFQTGVLALVFLSLPACASTAAVGQTSLVLPLETVDRTGGHIASARVSEMGGRFYVAGQVKKSPGIAIGQAAHVDVALVDRSGRVVVEKQADITALHPRSTRARAGLYPYVVSFPVEQVREAAKVRVSYSTVSHGS